MPPMDGIERDLAAAIVGIDGLADGELANLSAASRMIPHVARADGASAPDADAGTTDAGIDPIEGDGWFLSGWTKRIEVGANGVHGNAEGSSLRASVHATRVDERTQASVTGTYEYGTSLGEVTQNRLAVSGRAERLMVDSPWRSFVLGSYESDQFREWDHRLTAGGGFGYQVVTSERTSLVARGGMSAGRDVGGLDGRVRPEAILGLDFTHAIDERQRIGGAVDFLPDVGDTRSYRVNTRASWEIMIDPASRLSLRIGGENRHDTTASGGSRRDDLSYFAVLAVEF